MAFPYSGPGGNALSVALQIDSQVGSALAVVQQWRTDVNATGIVSSQQAERAYQTLVALHAYVAARGAVPGLAQAYVFLFPSLGTFNPGAEWNVVRQAIEDFAAWFQANWPEKTASGKLALTQFIAGPAGQLTQFSINLDASAKAMLVAKLDAVLAAFVTP